LNENLLCPIFEHCGLCTFLPLSSDEEKDRKLGVLQKLFPRFRISWIDSPHRLGYRQRISLRCDSKGSLGYYKPKSHDLIDISHCSIADTSINTILNQLPKSPTPFQSIEFRTNGERVIAQVYSKRRAPASRKKIIPWLKPFVTGIALDQKTIFGDTSLAFSIGNVQHRFQPKTFFQVNMAINQILVNHIIAYVTTIQPTHILDLYSGAGNIGLALVKRGFNVTLMESAGSSCTDARATCKRNQIKANIIESPAEKYIAGSLFFDLLILDPPRAGCGPKLKDFVLTKPKNIIYVSCHPYNLKKDASLLQKEGYHLQEITAFNMFPGTPHLETLCLFQHN